MSMSKGNAKHMSAESEKSFEEKLEGQDFGDLDDWAAHLGMEILEIEHKLSKSVNVPVTALLNKRLAVYNAALAFIENNPKAAALVGDGQGVKAVVKYIVSKAQEKAAEKELETYIDHIKPFLPGVKLSAATKVTAYVPAPAVGKAKAVVPPAP